MKKLSLVTFLFLQCVITNAQDKKYHQVNIGFNTSATTADFKTIGVNYVKPKTFKKIKLGYSFDYSYNIPMRNYFTLSGGVKILGINTELNRPENNAPVSGVILSINENLKLLRLTIPLTVSYKIIKTKKFDFFVKTGLEGILMNRCNRSADYYVPTPGSGLVKLTFHQNQNIKFGTTNNSSLGLSANIALGSNFSINSKMRYNLELSYSNDLSTNKYLTLKNIENDSYFGVKYSYIQLKLGYIF